MTRTSRETWLDEGLKMLRHDGVDNIRIDTLCKRLKMTKGSFYHHFKNHQSYLDSLLEHWEDKYTSQFIDHAEKGKTPLAKIERLNDIVLTAHDDPEVHIRAWALTDDTARDTVNRVDKMRIDYLVGLYVGLGLPEDKATVVSHTIYTALIGTQYVVPLLKRNDILSMFSYIAGLSSFDEGENE